MTPNGRIRLNAESLSLFTNDTEGKAVGQIKMNSQRIGLKTLDLNTANGEVEPNNDGIIQLFAPKIIGGHPNNKNKENSRVIFASGNVFVKGMNKTEVSQGQGKAMLQMEEGKTYLKADENEIIGKLTVDSKTSFKNLVTAENAAIKSLEVKSYIKTPHSTEGSEFDGGATPDPARNPLFDWDEEYEAIQKAEQEKKEKEEEERRKEKEEEEEKIEAQKKKDEEGRKKWEKQRKERYNEEMLKIIMLVQ